MAPLRASKTKSEWLPDDPMAFAPSTPWKLPCITTWGDSQSQNHPTNSAEEAKLLATTRLKAIGSAFRKGNRVSMNIAVSFNRLWGANWACGRGAGHTIFGLRAEYARIIRTRLYGGEFFSSELGDK